MPALHADRGGSGQPTLVLLHGLGGNATVWKPMLPMIEADWPGRWIAPDLAGHGRSPHAEPYGYASFAVDVARLIGEQDSEVDIIGHSMGGVVALALATGWFGIQVRRVLSFGVKLAWTDEEVGKLKGVAAAPVKWFGDREGAIERYLKVSGLYGLVDPATPEAAIGIVEEDSRFRLAAAQSASAAAGPDVTDFCRVARARYRLGAGANDHMVTLDQMTAVDPDAVAWPECGHSPHIERPDLVWGTFQSIEV